MRLAAVVPWLLQCMQRLKGAVVLVARTGTRQPCLRHCFKNILGASMGLVGSRSAESDPAKQQARRDFKMRRARATKRG